MGNEIKRQWGKRRTQTGNSLIVAIVIHRSELQWLRKRDHGGVVLREPNCAEIDPDIQEQRIVEFYLR